MVGLIIKRKEKKMCFDERFEKYYDMYMGHGQRNIPINCTYHHIIISNSKKNQKKISISPFINLDEYTKNLIYNTKDLENLYLILCNKFNPLNDFKTNVYLRMSLESPYSFTNLNQKTINKIQYCKNIYENKIREMPINRKFLIIDKTELYGHIRLTNIDYSGGNICVWTNKNQKRKGIATLLMHKILLYCNNLDYIPVFLVNRTNIPAINLAKSFGFKTQATEIIVATK